MIIAVYVSKGGVGKTTLAAHIAGALANAERGRVCAVDLDPQGLLANRFGYDAGDNATRWLALAVPPLEDVVVRDVRENLDLIPSNATLSPVRYMRGPTLLARLRDLDRLYSFVVLDLAPEVPDTTTLGYHAVVAADTVIIPVEGELQAAERARVTMRSLPAGKRFGWVASKIDARTTRWEFTLQPVMREFGHHRIGMVPRVAEVEKVLDHGRLAWEQAPSRVERFTDSITQILAWLLGDAASES